MLVKHYTVDFKICFFVLFLIFFGNSGILTAQAIIKNGSFETHKTGVYPKDITGALWYKYSELIKCIGFCVDHDLWPPVGEPSYCDVDEYGVKRGWYWATRNSSVDYFHLKGEGDAKSPLVGPIAGEMRYPYGYPSPNSLDSAFVGIRLTAMLNPTHRGTYFTKKEYLQSKLEQPLIGPMLCEVKFYVSRTRLVSTSITQMCVLFSDTAIVNPFEYTDDVWGWSRNLAYKTEEPIEYVTSAQICSDYPLDQSADINGYGGWQEIKGYLQVPAGETYNYITIGNFQDDYALTVDMYGGNLPTVIDYQFGYETYYFVDELSVRQVFSEEEIECNCYPVNYKFNIEKQAVPTDSSKCCYDFELRIPSKSVAAYFCDIRRFKIVQGTTVLIDSIIAYPYNYFNGYTVNGSFCLDDFNIEDNQFSLQLFTDADTLIQECTKDFTLNCFCVCSDMSDMINRPGGPKFQLQKVDSSESGRCCWDIIMTNSSATDSNACKFDLSNKYLIIDSDVPTLSYDFFYDEFTLTNQTPFNKILQAPPNFILDFGESKRIGTICSKGIPSINNEIELNFVFSNSPSSHDSVKCTTALKRTLSCDSVVACCDLFEIVVDSIYHFQIDSISSYCGAFFSLDYNNTPTYCNFDDSLMVVISNETMQMAWFGSIFKLSDAFTFPIPISPMVFFDGYTEFCIKFTNLRTNDTCTKCIILDCDEIGTSGPQHDLHRNIPDNLESDDIKIIPNPTDDIIDIYFNSKENSDSEISIYSLMGEEMLTKTIKVRKGKNSTRLSTIDLPPTLYYLKIDIDGKIMTKPVMVAR